MKELQDKILLLTDNDETRFFYHFTSSEASDILEKGLIVASKRWEESLLEFSNDEINNIESVLEDNKSTMIKQNNYMIIVGVPNERVNDFITSLNDDFYDNNWEGVGNPDYIIDSNYIVGYIDLNNLELYINEYSDMLSDNLYL